MQISKKILLIAIGLLVGGCVICGLSFAKMDFSPAALNTTKYTTTEFKIDDSFENIDINSDSEDVILTLSQDGSCKVVIFADENIKYDAAVSSDTLTVKQISSNSTHFGVNFNAEDSSVTIYLPEEKYAALTIDTDTGDMTVPENFSFEKADIRTDTGDTDLTASVSGEITITSGTGDISATSASDKSTATDSISLETDTGEIHLFNTSAGKITLKTDTGHTDLINITCSGDIDADTDTGYTTFTNVTCASLKSTGSSGDLYLKNSTASGNFNIKRDTGEVLFDGSDASEISVITSTGDVSGSLLTDKIFLTSSDTGNINVPKSTTGGNCEVTTDTGDIELSIK